MEDRSVELEIVSRLAHYAGRPAHAVTAEVRLWHDLGIAGEDFIALIDELHRAFGVTLAGELTVYCPPEYEAILAHWSRSKQSGRYRELPVSELIRSAALKVVVG